MINEIKLPDLSGGINTQDPEYGINDNQSPDMLNLWFRGKALAKRPGQSLVLELPDTHRIAHFNGVKIIHAGDKLYSWDDELEELQDGIEDAAGVFIPFGGKLYYIDGVEIWEIDSEFTVSTVDPYTPVVLETALPDLSDSADKESFNLIGAGFTVHYNGDGESTAYTLPQQALDDTEIEVVVNAEDLEEGTNFTVNRTTGTIDFAAGTSPHGAPTNGTNNVWITAYKTVEGNKDRIVKCTIGMAYGGETAGVFGGTRVFVMGNPDYPINYWMSDLGRTGYGMTYFPDTQEEQLDQNSQPITAAAKMGENLVMFKSRSIFVIGYAFDTENVYYPVRNVHDAIGCESPKSVQLIDNKLVFANTNGIFILSGLDISSESLVKPLSANINKILADEDLTDACSTDFEQYYWLCANGKVFLWDYGKTPYYNYSDYEKAQKRLAWYMFDNIDAKEFYFDSGLYHVSDSGIVKFTAQKNDFGQAISSYFKSKAFDLGKPHEPKTFVNVYTSFAADQNIKCRVSFGSEKEDEYRYVDYDIKSFGWDGFSWAVFTWKAIKLTKTYRFRLNMRKKAYLQFFISGGDLDRGVGVSSMQIEYYFVGKTKERE